MGGWEFCGGLRSTLTSALTSSFNADEHEVLRQFHPAGDEKCTPEIIQLEHYIRWLGPDKETAAEVMTCANMPDLNPAPYLRCIKAIHMKVKEILSEV
jgi:hypothetical protein